MLKRKRPRCLLAARAFEMRGRGAQITIFAHAFFHDNQKIRKAEDFKAGGTVKVADMVAHMSLRTR